jgi:hypothetical protein
VERLWTFKALALSPKKNQWIAEFNLHVPDVQNSIQLANVWLIKKSFAPTAKKSIGFKPSNIVESGYVADPELKRGMHSCYKSKTFVRNGGFFWV